MGRQRHSRCRSQNWGKKTPKNLDTFTELEEGGGGGGEKEKEGREEKVIAAIT